MGHINGSLMSSMKVQLLCKGLDGGRTPAAVVLSVVADVIPL
jgi:hypothetical protein